MKITKFTKIKNGMYKLTLDNSEIKIHENLILKYNLLLTKEITNEEIEVILKENEKYISYDIALKELNKRLRSKSELKEILLRKMPTNPYIDDVISMLSLEGYLDDERYAQSFVHDKILLTNDGPRKIEKHLKNNNIEETIIKKALSNYTEEIEKEKINKTISIYLKNNKKSKLAFQKNLQQILVFNFGFTPNIVYEILKNIEIDDDNNYKLEYDKLYKRLSKKYQGTLLEYKIKEKLYQKGFKIN